MEGLTLAHTVYAVVFGAIMVLGLPLNAVSLWILIRRHSLKSSNAILMVNLAFSDLLLAFSLPMRIYFYSTGTWTFSVGTCTWLTMLFRNNMRSSSIFITFISVDRLLAVVYPLRSRHLRTSSNAWKSAIAVWLILMVVTIPGGVMFSRGLNSCNDSTCFELPRCEWNNPVKIVLLYSTSAFLLIVLVVNIVSTALVAWTLSRHLSDSAQVNNKVNVMLIYVMNLIMIIVCFLPLSLALLFNSWKPARYPLVCLTSVNCCLDPFLYYFSLDAFWKKKVSHKNPAVWN
ncbi:lysophosphatidic acid receptor 6-like [Thalassophryne amazonica]|uniref:lysophosphatidic acid receptor 6-like n=1 Tax=Thalassophryne amazonica TaxID=390379 RepID=UPI00147152FC|nr:lysophosphatidic acid receptor 6-like [Thalassophryne amazonica]